MTKLALDARFRRLYFDHQVLLSTVIFIFSTLDVQFIWNTWISLYFFECFSFFFPRISFVVFRVFLLFIFLVVSCFFTIYQRFLSYCSWNCLSIRNSYWGGGLIYRTNPWKTPISKRINRNNFQKHRLFYRSLSIVWLVGVCALVDSKINVYIKMFACVNYDFVCVSVCILLRSDGRGYVSTLNL